MLLLILFLFSLWWQIALQNKKIIISKSSKKTKWQKTKIELDFVNDITHASAYPTEN